MLLCTRQISTVEKSGQIAEPAGFMKLHEEIMSDLDAEFFVIKVRDTYIVPDLEPISRRQQARFLASSVAFSVSRCRRGLQEWEGRGHRQVGGQHGSDIGRRRNSPG